MTDEELMHSYVNGDISAFQTLYQRYKGRVYGYLYSRLNNSDEAEEVFQEIFAKFHGHRFEYEDDIPFIAWLFTIVKNALIDHIRKRGTYKKYLQLDSDYVDNATDNSVTSLPIADAISELSSLSTTQRQVLEMRFNEGLSFEDIAAHIKTTQSNTRQIVSRAIRQLRRLMSGKERNHE
jgi:RNA polymerase sigma factor (sigma-70 family)